MVAVAKTTQQTSRKGIILAGGRGTRLYPITRVVNKQLLPVYDKPMVYYPLTTLMLAGIREMLVICGPRDTPAFRELLGNGQQWGLEISYAEQEDPNGIAEALIIGGSVFGDVPSALILGDNIFFGDSLPAVLRRTALQQQGATIFGYPVSDPSEYGVVKLDDDGGPTAIVEKPESPQSNLAVPGLYFYDENAPAIARELSPSARGELEITDLNRVYLERGELLVERLGRGIAWLDSGTHDSLLQATHFVQVVETRTGLKIACPEEIAYNLGYISQADMLKLADGLASSSYGDYLQRVANAE
jgi:glucose-1-phosphate thymidylyltransferase